MRTLIIAALLAALPVVAPAATVYEVNTNGATQTGSKNNGGAYIGQSFNSGDNTLLTAALLQINSNELAVGEFTLNLHEVTGTPNNYFKTGNALASGTFSNSILSQTLGSFYQFNNLNWAMSKNTVYMIGISSETEPTVKWTLNQSATKDSETGFLIGYSGYNAQEGNNVDNGLHGATIYAVPEPSTSAMVIAGACCCGLIARRRRPRSPRLARV